MSSQVRISNTVLHIVYWQAKICVTCTNKNMALLYNVRNVEIFIAIINAMRDIR